MAARKVIAAVATERLYGGPEEGGWYYDWSDVLAVRRVRGKARRRRHASEFRRRFGHLDDGRDLSSVLSTGRMRVLVRAVSANEFRRRWQSTRRPHYE